MNPETPIASGLQQWSSNPEVQSAYQNQQNTSNDSLESILSSLGIGGQSTATPTAQDPAATSALQQYAQQQVQAAFPNDPNAWNAFDSIVNQESGWNPQAANSTSSARGLGQFLTSTSQEYGLGSDASQADPQAQVNAMIKYITNRYGTASNAEKFHVANGYY